MKKELSVNDLGRLSSRQLDALYFHVFKRLAYHLSVYGYNVSLQGKSVDNRDQISLIDGKGRPTGKTFTLSNPDTNQT